MGEGKMFPDEPENKNLFNVHLGLTKFFYKWLFAGHMVSVIYSSLLNFFFFFFG